MKRRLIMNTINNKTPPTSASIHCPMRNMAYNFSKLAFYVVLATNFGVLYIATSSNATAFNTQSDLLSSRSSAVNDEDKPAMQATMPNNLGNNEARQAALMAINQLELVTRQRKTRDQVIHERKEKFISKNAVVGTLSAQSARSGNYTEFGIYDASSRLLEDFDYDGFYQTFSITFDADVYGQYAGERANVFADLYLSHDGGPWELYFTTDFFTIVDDISEDEFEVITTLDFGYTTSHYNVLIDLYEVTHYEPVATISSEYVEALYALPLESSINDEYVVVESYPSTVIVGGGVSIYGLLALVLALGLRFFRRYKENQ